MSSQYPVPKWIEQLHAGKEEAYRILFDEYYQMLCVFAMKYIKDKEDLVPMRVDDTIMFLTLDVGDVPTIKSVRLALGLSEEAAAEYLMIPVCTFKDWEKGISIDDSSTKVAIRTLAKYHRYKK